MFKPHVTVACVNLRRRQILVVEGRLMVKRYRNQPAGHLEANETLVEAAAVSCGKKPASARSRNTLFVCIGGLRR